MALEVNRNHLISQNRDLTIRQSPIKPTFYTTTTQALCASFRDRQPLRTSCNKHHFPVRPTSISLLFSDQVSRTKWEEMNYWSV